MGTVRTRVYDVLHRAAVAGILLFSGTLIYSIGGQLARRAKERRRERLAE